MTYSTILYAVDGPVARITLNRPEALNTIVPPMPDEIEDAVAAATREQDIKVIVVRGAGRAFSAGRSAVVTSLRVAIARVARPPRQHRGRKPGQSRRLASQVSLV